MDNDLKEALIAFNKERKFTRKGPLCVALVVTQHARKMGLPLNPDKLLTEKGGQVLGLGKGAVQAVLKRHDITRVLAAEGGRTSRGSIDNMRAYVAFLNAQTEMNQVNLDAVEVFWIQRVHDFFRPSHLRYALMPRAACVLWFEICLFRLRNDSATLQVCSMPERCYNIW